MARTYSPFLESLKTVVSLKCSCIYINENGAEQHLSVMPDLNLEVKMVKLMLMHIE